jgi:hypothetical protein
LLRLLIAKETEMRRRYDVRWRLTGVATRRAGWVYAVMTHAGLACLLIGMHE